MFFTIILFNDSFIVLISVSFTSLILIEMMNVLFEVNRIEGKMILAVTISIVVYFGSIRLLPTLFQI